METNHRKRRILFTREQTYELQKVFQYQQYLTVPQRDYLSRRINLTPTQVTCLSVVSQQQYVTAQKTMEVNLSSVLSPFPNFPVRGAVMRSLPHIDTKGLNSHQNFFPYKISIFFFF